MNSDSVLTEKIRWQPVTNILDIMIYLLNIGRERDSLHALKQIVRQNRSGIPIGVCSVCSSNGLVIESAMEEAKRYHSLLLVEATANQVNQFGGYTGMSPSMFRSYVYDIAVRADFDTQKVMLGGDHLGPLTWKNESAKSAMEKAKKLVKEFAEAGFTKIHLDTSMKLGDDGDGGLNPEVIAQRTVELCETIENALEKTDAQRPVYVIGSEVPVPGGTQTDEGLKVTAGEDFTQTVELYRKSFLKRGLDQAWENVVAVVVQPGVEFGSNTVHNYCREEAKDLIHAIEAYPDIIFEGHSTDYQTQQSLLDLVEDHVAILKVGPALTFALREGLVALEQIEKELLPSVKDLSGFSAALENAMLVNPVNWANHYRGSDAEKRLDRKYSYSDRCRYYLSSAEVDSAVHKLFRNLNEVEIPMILISQYFPSLYWKIRDGQLKSNPRELAKGRVKETLDMYYSAVGRCIDAGFSCLR